MGTWHDLGLLVISFTAFIWAQSKLKIHLLKILPGMHSSGWLRWESALHFSGSSNGHYSRRDGTSLCRAAASHGLCLPNHRGTPEKPAQHCASGEPCKTEAWGNYNIWVKWWHSGADLSPQSSEWALFQLYALWHFLGQRLCSKRPLWTMHPILKPLLKGCLQSLTLMSNL